MSHFTHMWGINERCPLRVVPTHQPNTHERTKQGEESLDEFLGRLYDEKIEGKGTPSIRRYCSRLLKSDNFWSAAVLATPDLAKLWRNDYQDVVKSITLKTRATLREIAWRYIAQEADEEELPTVTPWGLRVLRDQFPTYRLTIEHDSASSEDLTANSKRRKKVIATALGRPPSAVGTYVPELGVYQYTLRFEGINIIHTAESWDDDLAMKKAWYTVPKALEDKITLAAQDRAVFEVQGYNPVVETVSVTGGGRTMRGDVVVVGARPLWHEDANEQHEDENKDDDQAGASRAGASGTNSGVMPATSLTAGPSTATESTLPAASSNGRQAIGHDALWTEVRGTTNSQEDEDQAEDDFIEASLVRRDDDIRNDELALAQCDPEEAAAQEALLDYYRRYPNARSGGVNASGEVVNAEQPESSGSGQIRDEAAEDILSEGTESPTDLNIINTNSQTDGTAEKSDSAEENVHAPAVENDALPQTVDSASNVQTSSGSEILKRDRQESSESALGVGQADVSRPSKKKMKTNAEKGIEE